MKKFQSYLDQLTFSEHLKDGVYRYLGSIRLVSIAVLAIIFFGIFSLVTLERRLNPEVAIPIVTVVTQLPGANPSDVETLITSPLEDSIAAADGIDTLTSTSQDSISVITAQFVSSVSVKEAEDEVRRLVEGVSSLPSDATDPSVRSLDFENAPVWEFVLTSQSNSTASLDRFAQRFESEIESLRSVDRVEISGIEEREIQVVVKPEVIRQYALTPQQLQQSISSQLSTIPGGVVSTQLNSFGVSIAQPLTDIQDIAEVPVQLSEGAVVPLGTIAEISLSPKQGQYSSWLVTKDSRQQAVLLSVYKRSGRDLVKTQQEVDGVVEALLDRYDSEIQITTLTNIAEDISVQFQDLFRNFASTIGLVFLTLLLFIGLRQAVLASLSIPLTFLVSFSVMSLTGQSLNFLTLFSLLLSLGLLLDDAIVVIASTTEYYAKGSFSPLQAGRLVWRDFIVPIWTTTLTTVWAFLPLVLATGIIGEFIKPIPIVVSASLLASTAVAVLITLPLLVLLLKLQIPKRIRVMAAVLGLLSVIVAIGFTTRSAIFSLVAIFLFMGIVYSVFRLKNELRKWIKQKLFFTKVAHFAQTLTSTDSPIIDISRLSAAYQRRLRTIVGSAKKRRQVWISVLIFAVVSYALLPLGYVKNVFFPASDSEVIYVGLEYPNGTALVPTQAATNQVLEVIKETVPEFSFAVLEYGLPPVSPDGFGSSSAQDWQARISLRIPPEDERTRSSEDIVTALRSEFRDYKEGRISIFAPSGGPPAGSDITVKILGDDLGELANTAQLVEDYLEQQDGVVNINRSTKSGTSQYTFVPDTQKIAQEGILLSEVGLALRTALSGYELDTVTLPGDEDDTPINFTVSLTSLSPEDLGSIPIVSRSGVYSLSEFGRFELQTSPTQITHEEQQRSIVVTAGVSGDATGPEVNAALFEYLDTIELPPGYTFATGGANEENQRSVQSILQAMLLSFILILGTMVIQLGSFRKALIVMLVIPLAVSGVFSIFALTGTPLSFPGLIGVLALFGIVVNNSIVLVDKITQNIRAGLSRDNAIVDAAGSRLQPIFFSSLTTIIGLIPITLSDPIWRGLGGAIIAGLSVSGLLMLLIIPVLYASWFRAESLE